MRFLFCLLLLTSTVHARLGDSSDQLVDRLGDITLRSKHSIVAQGRIIDLGPCLYFKKDGWNIRCDMINEKCEFIHYSKTGDWTEAQIKFLLDNNKGSGYWRVLPESNKMIRKWSRSDRGNAVWQFTGKMDIQSGVYVKHKLAIEKQLERESKRLPGL